MRAGLFKVVAVVAAAALVAAACGDDDDDDEAGESAETTAEGGGEPFAHLERRRAVLEQRARKAKRMTSPL